MPISAETITRRQALAKRAVALRACRGRCAWPALIARACYRARSQLWVALCAYLLVAYARFLSAAGWSMRQILRLLQLNLFERRSLAELFKPPDLQPLAPPPQLLLLIR